MAAGWGRVALAALAAVMFGAAAAQAQMSGEEQQRCVWSCLANSPGASSKQYNDCVERYCVAPRQSVAPKARTDPARGWTSHRTGNGAAHSAAIEAGGRSLSYICQRGGPGLLAIAGMGGGTRGVAVAIDGRSFRQNFVTRGGILYTDADPGSALLAALMAGNEVRVTGSDGRRAAFPLTGSGAAIRGAMAACGLRR